MQMSLITIYMGFIPSSAAYHAFLLHFIHQIMSFEMAHKVLRNFITLWVLWIWWCSYSKRNAIVHFQLTMSRSQMSSRKIPKVSYMESGLILCNKAIVLISSVSTYMHDGDRLVQYCHCKPTSPRNYQKDDPQVSVSPARSAVTVQIRKAMMKRNEHSQCAV